MRLPGIVLGVLAVLGGPGMALAAPSLKLEVTVGFDGYYRPRTQVPVFASVENGGATVRGEFRVSCPERNALRDAYRVFVTIPRGAKQRHTLYIVPEFFARAFTVEFWSQGRLVTATTYDQCRELYAYDRLLAVVGGAGSSLIYVDRQGITTREYRIPRPWDDAAMQGAYPPGSYRRSPPPPGMPPSSSTPGMVRVLQVNAGNLPDTPEGYGSIDMLALMSDVTENTLSAEAQAAIPAWVATGGHLVIAGGGVAARLEAPFFARLLPPLNDAPISDFELLTNADGQRAFTAPVGAGRVTFLDYDPDASVLRNPARVSEFYGKLAAREPRMPLTFSLRDVLGKAVQVRNLRPPDLRLIVIFLLVYLILLVPVNYFVLKKLDKRELAWLTTPVIVLLFTAGAYGIGYVTKGNRLVLNTITMVETAAGHPEAEAISNLLIFSPARTAYRLNLGATGLLAREVGGGQNEYDPYASGYRSYPGSRGGGSLTMMQVDGELIVDQVRVDMWAFRQFVTAHRLDMGKGFSAALRAGQPATSPRATGTITNNTPLNLDLCELYLDGSWAASFALKSGQTVTVEQAGAAPNPRMSEDEKHMLDILKPETKRLFSAGQPLAKGFVLVGFATRAGVPLRIDGRPPTAAATVVFVHL